MIYDLLIFVGTLLAIHVISTIPERLLAFAVMFLILHQVSGRFILTKRRKLVSALIAGLITLPMGLHLGSTILRFLPVIFIPILAMLFFISTRLVLTKRRKLVSAIVAGCMALLIDSTVLTDLHRTVFSDPSVTRFARGHFNALAINKGDHILYAIGEGTNHIQAYNIDALDLQPKLSELETGKAETAFVYNDQMNEIYLVPRIRKSLLTDEYKQLDIVDPATLALKESLPVQSPQGIGGQWVEFDPQTGYIIIAAESRHKELGKATVIINRKEGKIVKELSLAPMNIYLNPSRSLLYLGFFQDRQSNEIILYDLKKLAILSRTQINARLDRMAYLEHANELLVTVPVRSLIYRLDADTLARKGEIRSSFGVRTMAVDTQRNLLLTVSLVTNTLDVIDLTTYQSVKRYYLAPMLRSVVIDGNGNAYVSCFTGLFRVRYAQ